MTYNPNEPKNVIEAFASLGALRDHLMTRGGECMDNGILQQEYYRHSAILTDVIECIGRAWDLQLPARLPINEDRAGARWTMAEVGALKERFADLDEAQNMDPTAQWFVDTGALMKRTPGAILAKLYTLKLLDEHSYRVLRDEIKTITSKLQDKVLDAGA